MILPSRSPSFADATPRLLPDVASLDRLQEVIRTVNSRFQMAPAFSIGCPPLSTLLKAVRESSDVANCRRLVPHLESCLWCAISAHDFFEDLASGVDPLRAVVETRPFHDIYKLPRQDGRTVPRRVDVRLDLPGKAANVLYAGRSVPWSLLKVSELLELLVVRHDLPVIDERGKLLTYRVYWPKGGRCLEESQGLGEAGLSSGDLLSLFPADSISTETASLRKSAQAR
jgi:hypothetical protein